MRIDALLHREGLTLSSLNLHCHLHPLQAANCVADEDDLMWVKK